KVCLAQTNKKENNYIKNVVKEKEAKKVVKEKSMVTEEIGLNDALADIGSEVVETDLGEWILQLDEDPPSHIVTPALHKNKEQIQESYHIKCGYEGSDTIEDLGLFAREQFQKDYSS